MCYLIAHQKLKQFHCTLNTTFKREVFLKKKYYCNYLSILTNKFSTLVTLVTNIYFGAGHFLCKLFYLKLNGHCGLMAHYAVQFCSLLVDVDLKRILFSLGQSTAALCDCRLICTLPYMALFISSAWALT